MIPIGLSVVTSSSDILESIYTSEEFNVVTIVINDLGIHLVKFKTIGSVIPFWKIL